MRCYSIPVIDLYQVWPLVAPMIQESLEKCDPPADYNIHHAQQFLTSGTWALIVADDGADVVGACTVVIQNHPTQRVAFITSLGGRGILTPEGFDSLRHLLQKYGVTKIRGYVRPSVARLAAQVGFTKGDTLVECGI